MLGTIWLKVLRSVRLAAPTDGLCTWQWTRRSVTSYHDRVLYETDRFKCVLPWRHGDDHEALRIKESA